MLLVVVAVLGVGVAIAKSLFWMPAVLPHRGDGAFANISQRVGPLAVPGYSIAMPEFDLTKPFQAEYRIANMPDIGRECGVYLAFHDSDHKYWDGPGSGRIEIELVDSRRTSIIKVAGGTEHFIWYGFQDIHAAYQLHRSFFAPNVDEEYTVRVSWEPGTLAAPFKGFIYLECGGSI